MNLSLEYQNTILAELLLEDGLLILSRGLRLFGIICALLKMHVKKQNLVLLLNASSNEEQSLKEGLAELGMRKPGLKIVNSEMGAKERNALYLNGGILSITSRVLIVDLLNKTMPTDKITGILMCHAERITDASTEAFILRIYRQENKDGFIKAFSDSPESFTSGLAPLQTTLRLLHLRKVFLWPRFNLEERGPDVVELHQPLSITMNGIQAAIIQCMEACLSDIKRGNPMIDIEDLTTEDAMNKSFDLNIRLQLEPFWHRISQRTKHLVGDLTLAKQRVYVRVTPKDDEDDPQEESDTNSEFPPNIHPVLEELPKWNLLGDIMNEIEHEIELCDEQNQHTDNLILIMTEDIRTCTKLREYLSTNQNDLKEGETRGRPLLNKLLKSYFRNKEGITKASRNLHQYTSKSKNTDNTGNKMNKESEFISNKRTDEAKSKTSYKRAQQPPNKRRRVRGGSIAAAIASRDPTMTTNITPHSVDKEIKEIADFIESSSSKNVSSSYQDELDTSTFSNHFGLIPTSSLVVIRPLNGEDDDRLLESLKPKFIIIYHPDPAFVRRVEVYKASNPNLSIRVYFMMYEDSVEEQRYLTSIRKEKEAFERLIREKATMALPIGQMDIKLGDFTLHAQNTRVAGGGLTAASLQQSKAKNYIFALPSMIHSHGIEINPCRLEVGDYILTPKICVERKSISDLIGSFSSGRLYSQCEAMSIYYKQPILLIEFEHNKAFSLTAADDVKSYIGMNELSSKLVLLTLTFSRLKIIWSSSPYETVQIFQDLKKSQDEPDPEKAMAIGFEGEDIDSDFNITPQDFLRALPGITSKNYKHVMSRVENLKDLGEMSLTDMQALIGAQYGRLLYDFFNRDARV
ncbi:10311_t:CDS:10 [Ambispora gerdemannii]|uniref:10311_t:CDS:1 n=1 Tax=Ambispora gerdemannii TaxID=144530 RepID=A0A9N8VA52_9GLOM|nr:10311_t:CDS:10 [Ambispora gerdemannii]